jgi:phage terminase large subunit
VGDRRADGAPRSAVRALAGAIYDKELGQAKLEGRINPDVGRQVEAGGIDLGRADMTSIWFWQQRGDKHYAVDFYENCGFGIDHYLVAR